MKIGLTIRALRSQKELTLEQLAASADIDPSYLARIERGQRQPSMEMLESIAKALSTKVSMICALAESEEVSGSTISRTDAGWEGKEELAFRRQYLSLTEEDRVLALELLRTINKVKSA